MRTSAPRPSRVSSGTPSSRAATWRASFLLLVRTVRTHMVWSSVLVTLVSASAARSTHGRGFCETPHRKILVAIDTGTVQPYLQEAKRQLDSRVYGL